MERPHFKPSSGLIFEDEPSAFDSETETVIHRGREADLKPMSLSHFTIPNLFPSNLLIS